MATYRIPYTPPSLAVANEEQLCRLRQRYQEDHDLFSAHEIARLRFMRWLIATGRLRISDVDQAE